ncbi:MAG: MBL fold metallo-hydrolase [Candidatus Electryonea clarkiae]|nr:MBL fold metallo-hydrolase [Candidatus Electryonea clarkiae]MDP8285223.1 MBL fold metallo-hydrolase [Candidatus Electryonea clarkiae]
MQKSNDFLAVCPLGSGSKGNSWWIECSGTTILVDAGLSFRQLSLRADQIGRNIDQVDHVFITHEHGDHVKAIPQILKKLKPTLWASGGTLKSMRKMIPDGASVRKMDGKVENVGSFKVRAIPISHDAAQPLAFRFDSDNGSVAIITDLGQWESMTAEAVREVDIIACEANHDPYMLTTGPYPPFLKQRVASGRGHLSNADGAKLAREAVRSGAKYVVLSHLSQTNNMREIAHDAFAHCFEEEGLNPQIEIASQSVSGPWIEIS